MINPPQASATTKKVLRINSNHSIMSVETTPMGSRGIPSTVGGRGAVERVGLEDQHGEFIQVRAASDA